MSREKRTHSWGTKKTKKRGKNIKAALFWVPLSDSQFVFDKMHPRRKNNNKNRNQSSTRINLVQNSRIYRPEKSLLL